MERWNEETYVRNGDRLGDGFIGQILNHILDEDRALGDVLVCGLLSQTSRGRVSRRAAIGEAAYRQSRKLRRSS